jgi:hypothetical protein
MAKNVASLMAPHQVVALSNAPSLTESQLLHRILQLDPLQWEKLLEDMQRTMRQRQEGLCQQLGELRMADPLALSPTGGGFHTSERPKTFSQSNGHHLPLPSGHHDIRFTIPSQGWQIHDPEEVPFTFYKDSFLLNHVSDNDPPGTGVIYFISCLTKQGWQRFTLTYESQKTIASMGFPTRTWREREILAEKLLNAMWKSLLSNNFTGSATNLNICRDGQGYFARCTEDLKYAIEYPSFEDFAHLKLRAFSETELKFVHHWAGWVYVVSYDGIEHVKKEIPMQEQVESFNYELDALSRLQHSPFVLNLYGVVTDGSGTFVKGMLVEDLRPLGVVIRDEGNSTPWSLKMRWATQILSAIADIHKMGIVMGEVNYAQFGLTREDNIKAMGIKKRGCPTGWEAPEYLEIKPKDQNAGIFGPQVRRMGQMMDMYQAGLCLWMLATDKFPENYDTLPPIPDNPNIRGFYRDIVETCLQKNPEHREDASSLLRRFPPSLRTGRNTVLTSLVSRL